MLFLNIFQQKGEGYTTNGKRKTVMPFQPLRY